MKELSKYSRLAGYLERLYDKLNDHFFDGQLDRPVITIQSTPRAYGHYTLYDAWSVKGAGRKEINIGAGTLDRPVEYTVATLLHEMTHQYNQEIANIQDCSRVGTYHNKYFKQAAEAHGLICTRSEKYGWSNTSAILSDELLQWILDNDIQEIKLTRHDYHGVCIVGGNSTPRGGTGYIPTATSRQHNFRYQCPCCHAIARSGKPVRLICGDCLQPMT